MNLSFLRSKRFWIIAALAAVVVALAFVFFGKVIGSLLSALFSLFTPSVGKRIAQADQKRMEAQDQNDKEAEQKKQQLLAHHKQEEERRKQQIKEQMGLIDKATKEETPDQLRQRVLREMEDQE